MRPLTAGHALTAWQFPPLVSALLVLLAAAYLGGVRITGRHPARPWPAGRTAAFLLGLAVIAVATQSSIGVYDDVLFSVHMVQHLLLIMVAPPLLVFGRPVTTEVRSAAYARAAQGVVIGLFGILVVLLAVNFVRRRRAARTEGGDA